jgi:DNA invertase Pin-like site-specific DNA recombinase
MTSELVKPHHVQRKAVIYIRHSTAQQVMTNQESLRLQYALQQRAVDLGWDQINVEVVDIDLGQSAATVTRREGFKDVIARVTLGEVGIILLYEVTRLARNCTDWYPLLDLCGYRQCLIGDRDGVYVPGSANDRLLLGLKGTISEVELHTLRGRLTAGLLSKAERGELALLLPAGSERDDDGLVTKDSNVEVQQRITLVFDTFFQLGSVGKIIRSFRDHALTVPRRARFGDIAWRTPTNSMLLGILKNPAYAGAFVYGRTRSCQATYSRGKLMTARRPMSEWKIVVRDRHPAYLDWESFERVEKMLSDEYKAASRYVCNFLQRSQDGALCQHLPADLIDAQVVAAFFAAVGPAELEAWTHAREVRRQSEEALIRAEAQQIERLRYQAHLAERQYNRVDPDNRLIAGELERRWEMALRALRQSEEAIVRHRAAEGEMGTCRPRNKAHFSRLVRNSPSFGTRPK